MRQRRISALENSDGSYCVNGLFVVVVAVDGGGGAIGKHVAVVVATGKHVAYVLLLLLLFSPLIAVTVTVAVVVAIRKNIGCCCFHC